MASEFPVHFFTLVLNGEPFIRYHLERFKALSCPWHWHIIEGLAELKHDTAWSLPYGAKVPTDVAREGRSVDGTAEYLDEIAAANPGRITLYRAPNGRMWDGKLEMVNAPLPNVPDDSLLWEVDSDELWTTAQIERMRALFLKYPQQTAAVFYCWYFVAPDLVINRRRRFQELEWRRAWRFRKGMKWIAHEPPILGVPMPGTDKFADVTLQKPFLPTEMEQAGLVFQHFAYCTEPHLAFKEKYYGYKGITAEWKRLQAQSQYPVPLKQFFNWPWVNPGAQVEPAKACGITPLVHVENGAWKMEPSKAAATLPTSGPAPRGILYLVWNGMDAMVQRSIDSVRRLHPEMPIHVHCLPDDANVLDKAQMAAITPFEETLYLDADTMLLDRIDFGFEMATRHGIALVMGDCPWGRRSAAVSGDAVEYDTGVLFFTRKAAPVFSAWKTIAASIDSSYILPLGQNQAMRIMFNDRTSFSQVLLTSSFAPFVLPLNWNFRPRTHRTWWGPVKVWHDYKDPMPQLAQISAEQARPESIIRYLKFNA